MKYAWLLALLVVRPCHAEGFGKWEKYISISNRFIVSMRSVNDDDFDPVISCRPDQTHCKFIMNADEFKKHFDAMWERTTPKYKTDQFDYEKACRGSCSND